MDTRITPEETIRRMMEAYGDAVLRMCYHLTQEENHRQWYFWIQHHEQQMGWQVTLDAQTGEILDLLQESFAGGNG